MGYSRWFNEQQRQNLREQWKRFGLTEAAALKLRHKAQTDLFFLGRDLLGYTKLTEHAHREVCAHYVVKDPDAATFEEFAKNYTGLHEYLEFLGRGGFKSTINIIDNVQWIVCFPDIRINTLTSQLELGQSFVGGTKRHFTLRSDGNPRLMPDGKPSLFQILFPEFCDMVPERFSGTAIPQWTTPARQDRLLLEPTIRAASMESGKTGTHCDIFKVDDAITPENLGVGKSQMTNLRNLNLKIGQARPLRVSYGFTVFVGTPQHGMDYLSQMRTEEERRLKLGQPPKIRMLVRPSVTLTARAKLEGKTLANLEELTAADVVEWFPEEIPLGFLQHEWSQPGGRDLVASQWLLDVTLKAMVKFARETLVARTLDWRRVPQEGDGLNLMTADLAYSTENAADNTVLLNGRACGGRFYVTDMVRGKFDEYELPRRIAQAIYRWRPLRVAIENSQGAKWLLTAIHQELERLGMPPETWPAIEFVSIGQGVWRRNEVNAQPVVRILGDGRLWFSNGINGLDDLYNELEKFPKKTEKDDIVAALNLMVNHFFTEAETIVSMAEQAAGRAEAESGREADAISKDWHDRTYAQGAYTPQPMVIEEVRRPPSGYGLLPNVLGDLPE